MEAASTQSQTFVTTRTGKTVHIGTCVKGQIQTKCGIGYSRYATGRAIPASLVKPEHICQRCAEMK
jgi:hypothetical protein